MKKLTFLIPSLLFISNTMFAQVSVNADGSPPDPSAMLDVKASNKGLLPPRVALTSIILAAPLTSPAVGLLVYNTATAGTPPNNVIPGYYYWNSTQWVPVAPPHGVNVGDMLYWNGTQWVGLPAGTAGQVLTINNGVPTWGGIQTPLNSTVAVTAVTQTSASSGGNVTSDGGSPVTARGVCWSTSPGPTTAGGHTTDGSGTGNYTSYLTGLLVNTLYYVRAYATNTAGTFYGNQLSFTTLAISVGLSYGGGIIFYIDGTGQNGLIADSSDIPGEQASWGCNGTLIGDTATAIGTGKANTLAIVAGCSTAGIAARVCNTLLLNGYADWFLPSKNELNQLYLQKNVVGGFATGIYWSSSEYDAFDAWAQYFSNGNQGYAGKNIAEHVRAIRAFSPAITLPSVTTSSITNITQTTSTCGGNVTSDGGSPVTGYGVCWSTVPNPTTANSHTPNGSGTGIFMSSLTGLIANTIYYVRAYASNSIGTTYGNQVIFTTLSFSVGLSYQGGIIFYIDGTGQHGLIAASSDQGTGKQWGCYGTLIGDTATSIGTGLANTRAIAYICNIANIAATICSSLLLNGYNDWFLPSRDELNQMYIQRNVIGGFAATQYWSSSEWTAFWSWHQNFSGGGQGVDRKDYLYNVRAVRAF